MKKILTAFLPALSLLTLGSCATTSQLTSTEDDGVYYSSKDRTTQNATASIASYGQQDTQPDRGTDANAGTDEAVNPEYRSGGSSSSGTGSTAYYDDDYSYAARIRRFNQPTYRGFGYGYYDFAYTDPFWYGGGYSPYGWGPGYYGSFYDPFYSPYAYGGTYININIGFGRFYRPYYNPWRYDYGYPGYGGYGYGYGGYGGYYDGYRNGYRNGLYSGYGTYGGGKTNYGPRRDGAREAVSSSVGATNGGRGRGRIDEGGVANPNGGVTTGGGLLNGGNGNQPAVVPGRGRGRIMDNSGNGAPQDMPVRQPMGSLNNDGRELTNQQIKDRERRLEQMNGGTDQPRLDMQPARGRGRVSENGNAGTDVMPTTPQDYTQPRRGRYRDMQPSQAGGGQEQQQQQQQRPTRQRMSNNDFSQPRQQMEQPMRQERSYSPGGNFGGGGGGGNDGGGSRGRGRIQ
ncbi:hypothetical protein [Hymenobacter persicinus]|uniref:Prolyl-tRNA synthetase n=1 Tax=Hymenobacter persicinus TaxID=2025506 RepID=A0A4Q5L9J2_9BACT|nr:hypothetical protein [Hymenobacter persicinus]RYU78411.1 hypothetical protein EWM57_14040 [Hymenobacter persicinus]